MNRFSNNNIITVIVAFSWLIIGSLVIYWQVVQIQNTPESIISDAKSGSLINEAQLQQALSYLKEDQLTSNAPSVTLNSEPASHSDEGPPLN